MMRDCKGWVIFLVCCAFQTFADTFILPPADVDLIGVIETTQVESGQDLLEIARQHDLGQNEILLANPGLDRWLPKVGAEVILPKRFLLPDAPREGIVLNVPEMRMYYYPKPRKGEPPLVITHPVSIGRMDWSTPLGTTRVISKVKNPTWRPPESIKTEHAADGDPLPDVVPPGPDNPLGRYALRLGIPGYLIHSTNKPFGIGMRVTHGCVRMYPEDIEKLFPEIKVGTPVTIVNQPVKIGWFAGELFMEVHPPLEEEDQAYEKILKAALILLEQKRQRDPTVVIDGAAFKKALQEKKGIPVKISREPGGYD